MTTGDRPRRESAFALLKKLVRGGIELAKLEITRGRQEIGEAISQVRGGIILLVICALLVLLFLILALGYMLTILVVIGLWWVALLLLLALVATAVLLGVLGYRRVRSAKLVPEETIESVKEDVEWAKRLLKRE